MHRAAASGARRCALAMLLAIGCLAVLTAEAPARGFMTGIADGIYENQPASSGTWFDRTQALDAHFVLLPVDWAAVSPSPPASGTATNPANPAYNWGGLDQAVRGAAARGLTVAFTVAGGGGPPWADGPHRPSKVQAGTWRPNTGAFGAFATAVARRYSGSFNPGSGVLPRVRYYQAWSEPNLNNHLTPQWVRSHGHWVAQSPIIYRGLLNAFYAGIKSVSRADVVITGGTAPFGDPPGGQRVRPAEFVRDMLCLSSRLRPTRCPNPPHFDILAHHPYAVGGPFQHALVTDDVSIPDIGELTRPLRVAERDGHALPRGHKRLWVTEFAWDSNPPDPQAVPMGRLEYWIEESFYELWHEHVDALAWFLIQDQAPVPNYASTYQSGLYFLNGSPKPSAQAFRFPFVVERAGHGKQRIWGLAPAAGTIQVQELAAGHWKTIMQFGRGAGGVFTRVVKFSGRPDMRAVLGGETSLTFHAP